MKKYKYIIPNFFTVISLVAGLVSINLISDGYFIEASWLICFAIICDGIDGKLARLLGASSEFGAQLDSFVDFVSFGVAPAFLAYKISLFKYSYLGGFLAVFYVLTGAFRLVRFNMTNDDHTKKQPFVGLPIPSGAGMISAYVLINIYRCNSICFDYLTIGMVITLSVLMISRLEYFPLEKPKHNSFLFIIKQVIVVISLVFAFKFPEIIYFFWMMFYILFGIIKSLITGLFFENNKEYKLRNKDI